MSEADKNSGLRGTERRESSIRGSELLEASKSLENMKGDEDIVAQGRGEEKSRGKEKTDSSAGGGTPGPIKQSNLAEAKQIDPIKDASTRRVTSIRTR